MHVIEGSGIKVTPRSPEQTVHELANALERLCLDEELRSKLGKAARNRAEQVYHWDRLGERLMGIYRQALSPG
jgi:glycosyltransferase involved in cell wall biosynthesis